MMEKAKDYSIIKSLLMDDEDNVAKNILKNISKTIDIKGICLYFISLSTGVFKLYSDISEKDSNDFAKVIESAELQKKIYTPTDVLEEGSNIFYPIMRKNTQIGVLNVILGNTYNNSLIAYLENIASLFIVVYERRFINNLFRKVQEPINFETVGLEEFYKEVMKTITTASGMRFIALRELDEDGGLSCLGLSGFGDSDKEKFNFGKENIPKEFSNVIETNKFEAFPNADKLEWIRSNPLLKDVKSFVAMPIRVGSSLFGILSFATKTFYEFSQTELLALESISNGIGIAITNYRNFNESKIDIASYSETAVVLSGLEIAQATRHEAKNLLDNCQQIIAGLLDSPKERISDKKDTLNKLSELLFDVKITLDKIKTATKPPQKVLQSESIKAIWNQALSALSGRISQLDIHVKFIGKEPVIDMYPDWLRQAFLNLLLNSIDAFKRGSKKRNREISLTVEKYSDDSDRIAMVYSDNAGGIDIANLEIPEQYSKYEHDLNQLIFCPNVTSKKDEGSGWGLHLVRQSIKHHNGSINLINYRGGVSFKIELFKKIK